VTTLNVPLDEGPTRIMNALHDGPLPWAMLRDEHGATSGWMSLLLDLRFITRGELSVTPPWPVTWRLTDEGRAAMRPADTGSGR
jgi:hypothetical protein